MSINFDLPTDPWVTALWVAIAIVVFMPALAMLTAVGFWMLGKIAPIRWVLLSWAQVLAGPAREWLGTLVREETEDIRGQVFPNGGSSMNDHLRSVLFELQEAASNRIRYEQDFGAFESILLELRGRLSELDERVHQLDKFTINEAGGKNAE